MKFIIVKKRNLLSAALALLLIIVLSGAAGITGASSVYMGKSNRKLPIYAVTTQEKKVALSFDAAWGADKTDRLMGILESHGIKATFFLVGMWVEKHGDKVKQLHEKGFEIGTHSNTHPDMTKLNANGMKLELETSSKLISDITGYAPKYFRPPFGAYSNRLLEVAESLNIMTIQWDVDSLDWKNYTAKQIAERVLAGVQPGSIVLMHNDGANTPDALELIILGLKNKGYNMVTVGEIVYQDNYTIDHTGRQIKNIEKRENEK